ncbi:MAG: LacI family transcriptional regulator [Erysipelotrichaceae bacterium]|nr:LacI family transcriptional regulator [Erysipelotrichaceae bacterium]
MTKRITIRDVADKAGCSVTTVSLVMNQKAHHIPLVTRRKVIEVATRIGYHPNPLAVGLVTNRTGVIGLIVPNIANPFFSDIAKKVRQKIQEHNYSLIISESSNEAGILLSELKVILDRVVDGVIITKSSRITQAQEQQLVANANKAATPVVVIDSELEYSKVDSVIVDHCQGGYLATRHLLDLGHKRIGCFSGPKNTKTSEERIRGYQKALAESGIEFDSTLVYEGDYTMDFSDQALQYFLSRKVTALFCLNDMMAIGVLKAARSRGLNVPKQLSVVGFDDIPMAQLTEPQLTTIHQPIEEVIEEAVLQLVALINKEETNRKNLLHQPRLIIRESTTRQEGKK